MRWMLAVVAFGCACGAKEAMDKFDESKRDLAKLQATKLAEHYAHWSMSNPAKQCPASLDEIAAFVGAEPAVDPWKRPFVMLCGADKPAAAKGIGVLSLGKDGQRGTPDDVTSWDP